MRTFSWCDLDRHGGHLVKGARSPPVWEPLGNAAGALPPAPGGTLGCSHVFVWFYSLEQGPLLSFEKLSSSAVARHARTCPSLNQRALSLCPVPGRALGIGVGAYR